MEFLLSIDTCASILFRDTNQITSEILILLSIHFAHFLRFLGEHCGPRICAG